MLVKKKSIEKKIKIKTNKWIEKNCKTLILWIKKSSLVNVMGIKKSIEKELTN